MKLTFEEKIEEYQTWVLSHGQTPPKKAKIKFSDGSDMRSWGHNWRRYVKDFIQKHPQSPRSDKLKKIEIMCENIETQSQGKIQLAAKNEGMDARISQYIEKTRELGRRPVEKDNLCFQDGKNMVEWYYNCNMRYGKITEGETGKPVHPFQKMKEQLYMEGYYNKQTWKVKPLTYQQKTKEYLEYVTVNKKVPRLEETFSDGVQMSNWYHNQLVLIRSEQRSRKSLSEERMKEVELFAWMENEILKIKDIPIIQKPRMTSKEKRKYFIDNVDKEAFCLNRNAFFFPDGTSINSWVSSHKEETSQYFSKSLTFEGRALEYLQMVKEKEKKLNTRDPIRFSDQRSATAWMLKQEVNVRKERRNNTPVSNLRMNELYILALVDDYIYTLNHQSIPNAKNKISLDSTPWVKRIQSPIS